MFRDVTGLAGEGVFVIGLVGLFVAGAATFIAEPILYVVERRRIERAALPAALPVARIVSA
jgi:hypothetical protein